jgi:ribosomal protein S27E
LEKYFYNNGEEDEDVDVVFSKDGEPEGIMELTCPHCNEEIFFEDQNGNYEVICPECGKVVWNSAMTSSNPVMSSDVI